MRLEEAKTGIALKISSGKPSETRLTTPSLSYQRGPGIPVPQACLLKRARSCDSRQPEENTALPRKRRRLRLGLVTSMLSRPFALPATHVPARKASRNGPWSRQRIAGRDLLRKAAIFNKIALKRRTSGLRGVDHRSLTRKAALIE